MTRAARIGKRGLSDKLRILLIEKDALFSFLIPEDLAGLMLREFEGVANDYRIFAHILEHEILDSGHVFAQEIDVDVIVGSEIHFPEISLKQSDIRYSLHAIHHPAEDECGKIEIVSHSFLDSKFTSEES